MTADTDPGATTLAPNEAFAVLGNETRMEILQTLGMAEEPLAFSELYDRVEYDTMTNFNYHLDKLVGHFVRKTDDGYELRQAGRRVIEAVLSGAVTDDPVLEPTPIDEPCPYCDTPILVAFDQERTRNYCPECAGHYGHDAVSDGAFEDADYGYLGSVPLPPAGLQGRTAEDVQQAATTWGNLELLTIASRVCPRCSSPLSESVRVCEDHDATDGLCDACDNRHAIQTTLQCPTCLHEQRGAFVLMLMANIDLLAFLITHGVNPVSPPSQSAFDEVLMNYEEELRSTDPFEARFTFTIDDDTLTLTVDDEFRVVEVTRKDSVCRE